MSEALIRAEIKSVMVGIGTTIGTKIYDYMRLPNDKGIVSWKSYLDAFKDTDKIRGWQIYRTSCLEINSTTTINLRTHTYMIEGFMSLDDSTETEKTFQTYIEKICETFRANIKLNAKAFQTNPIQVLIIEARMFGEVLCHRVAMSYDVQEEIQWR